MMHDELTDLEVAYAQLLVDQLELPTPCVDLAMRYALTGLAREGLETLTRCRAEHPEHWKAGAA